MEFHLLGPVRGLLDGRSVNLGVRRQRFVLAVLALEANSLVTVDRLIDLVWPDGPPATARGLVHDHVSRLRTTLDRLGAERFGVHVDSRRPGYTLRCDPLRVDAHRFLDLTARARADGVDDAQRLALFGEALALWHGQALADVTSDAVRERLAGHLEQTRLVAVEDRLDVLVRSGGHADVLGELGRLVAEYPLRERMVAQFMVCLRRDGQAAEALAVYQRTKKLLAEELGIDPGEELQQLELAILRNEPEPVRVEPAGRSRAGGGVPDRVVPRQLPADTSAFTGRGDELDEIVRACVSAGEGNRRSVPSVCVVEGMAGAGKTALAVHAGHILAPRFCDGQLFVDLHGFTEGVEPVPPAEALDRLLRGLGVPGGDIPPGMEERAGLWRTRLAGRRVLVVLDNAASEEQVEPLLPGTSGCAVLVTSRRRLSGLDDARPVFLDALPQADAVTLFDLATGGRTPTGAGEGGGVVERVVELCGRLPLAVRLAAARLHHRPGWTVGDLAEVLDDEHNRLGELQAGQRSVTAALRLSYSVLDADQQRMFRLLGLHPGTHVDPPAAAALAGTDRRSARRLLDDLVDVCLLEHPERDRYQFHDLTRVYAGGLAGEEPQAEQDQVLRRLYDHYLRAAWTACRTLAPEYVPASPGPLAANPVPELTHRLAAGRWLGSQTTNLLAVTTHAVSHGEPAHAVAMSQVLYRYLDAGMHHGVAHAVHSAALAAARQSGDAKGEADASIGLGLLRTQLGEVDAALPHLARAAALYRRIGDEDGLARALNNTGVIHQMHGRYEAALTYLLDALPLFRRQGNGMRLIRCLNNLSFIQRMFGRHEQALRYSQECYETAVRGDHWEGFTAVSFGLAADLEALGRHDESLARCRESIDRLTPTLQQARQEGDREREHAILSELGQAHQALGHHHEALAYHQQNLRLYEQTGGVLRRVYTLLFLGSLHDALGRHHEALDFYARALQSAHDSGDAYLGACAHTGTGHVLHALGDAVGARDHYQQAIDSYLTLGVPEPPTLRGHLAELDEGVTRRSDCRCL